MKGRIWLNLYDDLLADTLIQGLQREGFETVRKHVDKADRKGLLAAASEGYDCVIVSLEQWDRELIDAARPRLKLLIKYGTGVNNFDIPYATSCGIAIANLAGANAQAVAQIALTHILSCLRGYARACGCAREKIWSPYTGRELDGKVVGLIGFGQIAQHLARMLDGFQVRVMAYDIFKNEDALRRHPNVEFCEDMDRVLESSDIVSIHIPSTPQTENMAGEAFFSKMKDGAVFINTSRGELVDEAALLRALRSGKLSWAGLDVTRAEPFDSSNPLLTMPNVSVTPHIGAATLESEERCQRLMVEIASAFWATGGHARVINPQFAGQL